jgi:hypothetical protein
VKGDDGEWEPYDPRDYESDRSAGEGPSKLYRSKSEETATKGSKRQVIQPKDASTVTGRKVSSRLKHRSHQLDTLELPSVLSA